MKKNSKVIKFQKRKKKTVTEKRANRQRDSLLRALVHGYFTQFDPCPNIDWVPAKTIYQDFLHDSLTDCSFTKFGKLAKAYVMKKKLTGGRMYYRLTDDCITQIICQRDRVDGFEELRMAA